MTITLKCSQKISRFFGLGHVKVVVQRIGFISLLLMMSLTASDLLAGINPDKAKQIVAEMLGQSGYVKTVKSSSKNGRSVYIVKFVYHNGDRRSFTIDAETGRILR